MQSQKNNSVHVAVAVIANSQNQVLIAKRAPHQHQGDKWEFPGGKVEEGETSQEALVREVKEELGLVVESAELMTNITHHYKNKDGSTDKKVILDVYLVEKYSGEATGKEGQPLRWVDKRDLSNYEFPEANLGILALLMDSY